MQLKATLIGVEQVHDGVVIIIQQEKMKIPVAREPETDESIMMKKLARGLKGIGFSVPNMDTAFGGYRTGFWATMDDYEAMGKPTVGDVLILSVKVEK